jgi:hypothetical protein
MFSKTFFEFRIVQNDSKENSKRISLSNRAFGFVYNYRVEHRGVVENHISFEYSYETIFHSMKLKKGFVRNDSGRVLVVRSLFGCLDFKNRFFESVDAFVSFLDTYETFLMGSVILLYFFRV